MPNISEKVEWFVYESPRFFRIQQIIFRLHSLNSCDTMLFDNNSVQFATSGNATKNGLLRTEGSR